MYRQIETGFWDDPFVAGLNPDSKLVYIHLITCRHGHFTGLFVFRNAETIIALETGLPEKRVKTALNTLSIGYRYRMDRASNVVYLPKMMPYQVRKGSRALLGVPKHLETLHKSSLINDFLSDYSDWDIPYRYPIDTLSSTRTQEQEQEQEIISMSHSSNATESESVEKSQQAYTEEFLSFWQAYPAPSKGSKADAFKAWRKQGLQRSESLRQANIEAIDAYTRHKDACRSLGAFCAEWPHAVRWISKRRWEDDLTPPDDPNEQYFPSTEEFLAQSREM